MHAEELLPLNPGGLAAIIRPGRRFCSYCFFSSCYLKDPGQRLHTSVSPIPAARPTASFDRSP